MSRAPRALPPFEVLLERGEGAMAPLPASLARLYGRLVFPDVAQSGLLVISSLSVTIDGVAYPAIDRATRGRAASGGAYSHAHALLGLLRAVADVVVVGAATLRAEPRRLWLPRSIAPAYSVAWDALRVALGKPRAPLAVIVSASGEVDTGLPVFQQAEAPALLVTTSVSARRLAGASLGPRARVHGAGEDSVLSARAILDAISATLDEPGDGAPSGAARDGVARPRIVLVEGGPRLLGLFAAEGLLDEQFLTIAPRLAGGDERAQRLGQIEGQQAVPQRPTWARLVSARVAGDFLFLRYHLRG